MNRRILLFLFLVLSLDAARAFAQSSVPEAGIAAESAGNWTQALDVYKRSLDQQPHDAKLWVRVADIDARLGNLDGSVAALRRAIEEAPQDALLHQRLAQAYAMLQQPLAALDAIERALRLSPDSVEFLRARGTLATWVADYDRAQDSYRRLRTLQPDAHDVLLNLARVNAWDGRTDAAVEAYTAYLRVEPDAAAVWIELARAEGWRGNYGAALEDLEAYRGRFGTDEAYSRESAALLARGGRPAKALDTLEPLLRHHPDDYDLNLTRTLALTMQRRAREASDALTTVRRLQPAARDTQAAERIVRVVLGSSAEPGVSVYGDSSGLEMQRVAPRATVKLSTGTTFGAAYEHAMLTAPRGSDLAQADGSPTADHDHVWVSAAQQMRGINLHGRIGRERTMAGDLTSYAIGADLTPADGLKLTLERNSGFFIVSPRTISLGLQQVGHRALLDWSPTLRSQIVVEALYQTLSDGNRRWELTASPRRSVARTERLNLDLGAVVSLSHTATNYNNGYYDPSRYEFYGAAAYPYWKVSESVGFGASLALGAQRDDFSPSYRLGGNALGEATFGIYNAWVLKVSGGEMVNQRLNTGAFRGYGATVSLIRRF
ncbi:MAG TPA: tetratricopeptide repeat protein [Vicinamibacterales bacterium]|nr:tetratricopeptide repeat protein [Vicinamibacterales bacterium]